MTIDFDGTFSVILETCYMKQLMKVTLALAHYQTNSLYSLCLVMIGYELVILLWYKTHSC